MKKLMTIMLAFSVMLMAGNAFGQEVQKQNTKGKKEATVKEKKVKEAKTDKEDMENEADKREGVSAEKPEKPASTGEASSVQQPKGNAYGKNKGDAKGKEFGKNQSANAKQKSTAKKK